jgi:hypothetical protein
LSKFPGSAAATTIEGKFSEPNQSHPLTGLVRQLHCTGKAKAVKATSGIQIARSR